MPFTLAQWFAGFAVLGFLLLVTDVAQVIKVFLETTQMVNLEAPEEELNDMRIAVLLIAISLIGVLASFMLALFLIAKWWLTR